ncbi:hypothetical protein DE146DRAFT_625582 [Phaeosphaeria sp. MPI-PUGE-AT-0046c]|nr:hypothetical protein DE146DRAFT_625582 [Phaeosphaeria sp. MPI-PUGE-AT-0046c]
MGSPIASAVVLPEEPLPPASPNSKRRQSSISEQSAKRPRLDDDASIAQRDTASALKSNAPVRRERGRERRLFGAVLGALSQAPSTTAAQKRRSDIEKRQLAQRQQESEENEQKRADRIARRKVQRAKEQRRFEEQSYYKPWETSTEENDRIQDQICEAHKIIDGELEDWEARMEQNVIRATPPHETEASRAATSSHSGKEHDADVPRVSLATNGNTNRSHNSPKDQDMEDNQADDPGHEAVSIETTDALNNTIASHNTTSTDDPSKGNDDENGEDVVEEAAEDTVIY